MTKVRIIKTGEVQAHDDGYAARLIEQGAAVAVRESAKKETAKAGK